MKKKKKKIFLYILFYIFLGCTIFFMVYTFKYMIDANKTNEQIIEIQNITIVEETNNNESTVIIDNDNNEDKVDNSKNYYFNMSLINVSFDELKEINPDVKGWIYVPGTKISYPFVQTNDNKYYLKHSFDKSYNEAGWVFLDYRNDLSLDNNKNLILYGHNMRSNVMFGTLKNILNNGWLDNKENHVIKLSTEYENTLWQVFSVYHIPTTSDYIQTDFASNIQFENFANMLLDRSIYNFGVSIDKEDRIITLSTCYSNTERLVLHAKLIKKEIK